MATRHNGSMGAPSRSLFDLFHKVLALSEVDKLCPERLHKFLLVEPRIDTEHSGTER